jgi:GTPase SAR1 family protein
MTSQVNPNNIDGTYPIAGQDNDSQGFRDNFTNIRNNLTYAKAEIEDLQNKAVLKSALTNSTLSNDMAGNAIVGSSLTSWRETYNNVGAVSGATTTIDFANGNYQKITMGITSTTLAFTFPSNSSGQRAKIILWVNATDPAYTLTLPSAVSLGHEKISGISSRVITFNENELNTTNDYFFEFSTVDAGTTIQVRDLTRNYATNTNYAYHTVANGDNLFVNTAVKTYHIDTTNSDTIANLYVTVPDSAVDGHELALSFHAPVTSLIVQNVSANVAGAVKWVPAGTVSSGNVSINLTYSSGTSAWLRS